MAEISINRVGTDEIIVPIVGTAPLIVHKWSEKAKKQMLDAMQGVRNLKEKKDPDAEYEASLYRTDDERPGFPTLGFKAATVGAARFFGKSVPMTQVRQFVFFQGRPSDDGTTILTVIDGKPEMRVDTVTVGRGGTDLRYRAMFREWTAQLSILYVPSVIDRNSVVSLVDAGGLGVGVGEWRPEKSGMYGTYRVDDSRDVLEVGK